MTEGKIMPITGLLENRNKLVEIQSIYGDVYKGWLLAFDLNWNLLIRELGGKRRMLITGHTIKKIDLDFD